MINSFLLINLFLLLILMIQYLNTNNNSSNFRKNIAYALSLFIYDAVPMILDITTPLINPSTKQSVKPNFWHRALIIMI
jgi:CHASE3 domain sensor protein